MILPDNFIKHYVEIYDMIAPFEPKAVREADGKRVMSYGLGHFGYDIRMVPELRILGAGDNQDSKLTIIDPKNPPTVESLTLCNTNEDGALILPGYTSALTSSKEYFKIPEHVLGICLGKSSYARCGLIVNVTPLEPGWEGNLTIELTNTNHCPVLVYPDGGIAQLVFIKGSVPTLNYKSKGGKYQGQQGITGAKL